MVPTKTRYRMDHHVRYRAIDIIFAVRIPHQPVFNAIQLQGALTLDRRNTMPTGS